MTDLVPLLSGRQSMLLRQSLQYDQSDAKQDASEAGLSVAGHSIATAQHYATDNVRTGSMSAEQHHLLCVTGLVYHELVGFAPKPGSRSLGHGVYPWLVGRELSAGSLPNAVVAVIPGYSNSSDMFLRSQDGGSDDVAMGQEVGSAESISLYGHLPAKYSAPQAAFKQRSLGQASRSNSYTAIALAAIRLVLGQHALFRSAEQGAATRFFLEGRSDILAVLPTSAGKTLIAQSAIPLLSGGQLIMYILPLKSLAIILHDRLVQAHGRTAIIPWSPTLRAATLSSDVKVVISDFHDLAQPQAQRFWTALGDRLVRIVLDEVHELVEQQTYRPLVIQQVCALVNSLGVTKLCLSGTMPASTYALALNQVLALHQLKTVQTECFRSDLKWDLDTSLVAGNSGQGRPTIEMIADRLLEVAQPVLEQHAALSAAPPKALVIVRTSEMGKQLATAFDCFFIAAQDATEGSPDQGSTLLQHKLSSWQANDQQPFLIATISLSVGVDLASIKVVIAVDEPAQLVGLMQIAGRVRTSRPDNPLPSGLVCLFYTRYPRRSTSSSVDLHDSYKESDGVLGALFKGKRCIVELLSEALDGVKAQPCREESACSYCSALAIKPGSSPFLAFVHYKASFAHAFHYTAPIVSHRDSARSCVNAKIRLLLVTSAESCYLCSVLAPEKTSSCAPGCAISACPLFGQLVKAYAPARDLADVLSELRSLATNRSMWDFAQPSAATTSRLGLPAICFRCLAFTLQPLKCGCSSKTSFEWLSFLYTVYHVGTLDPQEQLQLGLAGTTFKQAHRDFTEFVQWVGQRSRGVEDGFNVHRVISVMCKG